MRAEGTCQTVGSSAVRRRDGSNKRVVAAEGGAAASWPRRMGGGLPGIVASLAVGGRGVLPCLRRAGWAAVVLRLFAEGFQQC